jgi:hypothetical protein
VLIRLKRLWHKLTHSKKRKGTKSRATASNAYDTLPYYYPTEQVDNLGKLRKKKKRRR